MNKSNSKLLKKNEKFQVESFIQTIQNESLLAKI